MTDDLRNRGIQALGKLVLTGDQEAWSEEKAWERDCISAYPDLEYLGPITSDEREYAEGLVQQRAPDFSLAHPSTYWLDAETIKAIAFTNAVRIYRLQQSERIDPPKKAPKRFTLWADAERAYSERVISTREITGRAPTEAEDAAWGKDNSLNRKKVRELRKNSPERTRKDRRKGNPAKK